MNKIKLAVISLAALVGVISFVPTYEVVAAPAGEIKKGINEVGGRARFAVSRLRLFCSSVAAAAFGHPSSSRRGACDSNIIA